MLASTPAPPYVAVIFTSLRSDEDRAGYDAMAAEMERLGATQPGFLGIESARGADGLGITVSYWRTADDARAWKAVAAHAGAQRLGRERWYRAYRVRVAEVAREYGFERE
jgi:heme-degrading monooxygenase HmoA